MTEEEILEMGAKPKKTKSKSITKDELERMPGHDGKDLRK